MTKKETAFVCEHCGTELILSKKGAGVLETIVCCGTATIVKEKKARKIVKKGKKKK